MRLGNAVRWVLALLGAAAGLCVGFIIPLFLAGLAFGMAQVRSPSSSAFALAMTLAVACSMIGWAWVGSLIVPRRHRRVALAVFSSPIVLLALLILGAFVFEGPPPPEETEVLSIVMGVLLAWIGISILALYRQYWTRGSERRMTVQQIADVFSDDPVQKAKE